MDLSTFSKETLINMIQDQQKLINELHKQINSYKIPAIPKQQKISSSDLYQVYNEDTQQMEPIDKDIVFRFGSGQIRYKKDNKYYHGMGPMEKKYAWYSTWAEYSQRLIVEFRSKDHNLPHKEWDTHNADEFCCNCKFNIEESRKKRVRNDYKCLGHTIE